MSMMHLIQESHISWLWMITGDLKTMKPHRSNSTYVRMELHQPFFDGFFKDQNEFATTLFLWYIIPTTLHSTKHCL